LSVELNHTIVHARDNRESAEFFAKTARPGDHHRVGTVEYARAVCEMWLPLLDPETVNQRVGSRLARQVIFDR
jgi:hypothetical protein